MVGVSVPHENNLSEKQSHLEDFDRSMNMSVSVPSEGSPLGRLKWIALRAGMVWAAVVAVIGQQTPNFVFPVPSSAPTLKMTTETSFSREVTSSKL